MYKRCRSRADSEASGGSSLDCKLHLQLGANIFMCSYLYIIWFQYKWFAAVCFAQNWNTIPSVYPKYGVGFIYVAAKRPVSVRTLANKLLPDWSFLHISQIVPAQKMEIGLLACPENVMRTTSFDDIFLYSCRKRPQYVFCTGPMGTLLLYLDPRHTAGCVMYQVDSNEC